MNMDHREAMELFSAYQDGDVTAEERASLEAHLAQCAACAQEWQRFREMVSSLSGLLPITPPVDTVVQVKQKIRRRSAGRFFNTDNSLSTRFGVVSFTLILAFMLGYLLLQAVSEISVFEASAPLDIPPVRDSATDIDIDTDSGRLVDTGRHHTDTEGDAAQRQVK